MTELAHTNGHSWTPAAPDLSFDEKDFPVATLSARERQVFDLIVLRGLSTGAIAEILGLKPKTIETHRAHINRKLNCKSSTELLRRALITKTVKVADLSP